MVKLLDVTKSYGKNPGVKNISLNVKSGQIVGLLGANGAGKTTTIKLITGYFMPQNGSVEICGTNMEDEPEKAKACVGYLPEDTPLYRDMTVEEYLVFTAQLKKADVEGLEEIVKKTGLAEVYKRPIKNLSKGYRQRVGMAQALVGNPQVLVLDEPTNGFDPKQRSEIRALIKEIAGDKAVILSSHILSEVESICDHVIVLGGGEVVASGTPQQLSAAVSGVKTLVLEVQGSAEKAKAAIKTLKGIKNIKEIPTANSNICKLEVETAKDKDIRTELFYALAEARLPIMALAEQTASLESMFLQLTAKEDEESKKK